MLNRFIQLFRRYVIQHQDVEAHGFELVNTHGQVVGQLEQIGVVQGRISLAGWIIGDEIALLQNGAELVSSPHLLRKDVAVVHGLDEAHLLGFTLTKPYEAGRCFLRTSTGLSTDPDITIYLLPVPVTRDLQCSALRVIPRFLYDLVWASPNLIRWVLTRDPKLRTKLKKTFGFSAPHQGCKIDGTLFASAATQMSPEILGTQITIILPVYNAFDLLGEVLERVSTHTDLPWRLVLIEDCSSDASVRPFLRQWVKNQLRDTAHLEATSSTPAMQIVLIENSTNLGFIGSVNKGLDIAAKFDTHVVLLNSDALVPAGWASRLIRPLLEEKNAASVTPMSNDAEIFTVPMICERHDLALGEADRIDAVARELRASTALCEVPTGVGYCMAMHRWYLDRVPQLDKAFGRGYGEEVDWCQKVRALGGRHLGLGALFVEHRGGTSFGSVEKQALVQANNAIISKRYPTYDHEVQTFIRHDPLASARLALTLAWVGSEAAGQMRARVPIYMAHAMGGGAENYLQNRIAIDCADGNSAIVLRVGGPQRWLIEVHSPQGMISGSCEDLTLLHRILAPITARHIVYSNGVGDRNPIELPALLRALKQRPDDQIEILVHDFLMLSPSYTLLDTKGQFRGVPDEYTKDRVHQSLRYDGSRIPLVDWRREWGKLMQQADVVVCFSENSRTLVLEAYPDIAAQCVVRPHQHNTDLLKSTTPTIEKRSPSEKSIQVIGVLGNIGYQKGAAVLRDMARYLTENSLENPVELVIIGNVDPAYPICSPAKIHGSYQIQDIPDLVTRYKITCWFIPSIWPETFSYTTHEALATGLPVWCFDLGAPSDTVAQAAKISGQGGIIPLDIGKADPACIYAYLTDFNAAS